jgi:hypothetical protein
MVGAVVSVAPVAGGTEAFGVMVSRCLFLALSTDGARFVVARTEADGVTSGETLSSRLFLFFSGGVAGVRAGLTEVAAFGAGETTSFRLSLPLAFGEAEASAAGVPVAAGGALDLAAGLAPVACVALAVVTAGEAAVEAVSGFSAA